MEFYKELKLRTNDARIAAVEVKKALHEYKVIKLVPEWYLGDLRAFYHQLTDLIGKPLMVGEDFTNQGAQTGEKWIEIRYDADIPDLAAYRHSKNAQPLHTDESYIANPADFMLFYCINKAEKGGETTFIDSTELVKFMEENVPDLLKKLTTTKVRYKKAGEQRTEYIIGYDDKGEIHFNFNFYCIDPDESDSNKQLNKDFFDFLQNYVVNSHMITGVSLNPGEGVLWWDELVLHGRTSYKASKTNDRFIWKTGMQWVD